MPKTLKVTDRELLALRLAVGYAGGNVGDVNDAYRDEDDDTVLCVREGVAPGLTQGVPADPLTEGELFNLLDLLDRAAGIISVERR